MLIHRNTHKLQTPNGDTASKATKQQPHPGDNRKVFSLAEPLLELKSKMAKILFRCRFNFPAGQPTLPKVPMSGLMPITVLVWPANALDLSLSLCGDQEEYEIKEIQQDIQADSHY